MPRTEKLVTLTLEGNIVTHGCQATLEIGVEQQQPDCQVLKLLPPAPELINALNHWQQSYSKLGLLTRIKPKAILYAGSINLDDCQCAARNLQERFARWLESDAFRSLDLRLREELNREDHIRVLIRSSHSEIQHLPWHLWDLFERYPHAEVALGAASFERAAVISTPSRSSTVRILAVLGHQDGINVERDRHLLATLPNASVEFLVEPERQVLSDRLWDQPWDILFFAGHSTTEGETGRIYLNPNDSLTIAELKYGLRRAIAQGLQLAIFNSCDGLGLARELEQLGLPQMIVMRAPVPDPVAQEFLKYFLTAFSQGDSLYEAERQARERLQGLEHTFPSASWLPILYQTAATQPPAWNDLCSAPVPSLRPLAAPPVSPDIPLTPLSRRLRLVSAIALSAISVGLVTGLRSTGLFQHSELQAYDHLMQLRPNDPPTDRVLVITATEADLNTYGYPLPDQVLLDAIQALAPYKPRVIGLDIFRDRLPSSHPLYRQFETSERLIALCSIGETANPDRPGIPPPAGLPEHQMGFSNVVVDPDGVLRRQMLFMQPQLGDPCTTRFSLSTTIAFHYLNDENIGAESLDDHRMQLGKATFVALGRHAGGYHNLDYWGFQVLFNPPHPSRPHSTLRHVSLTELLNHEIDLGDLTKTAVIIGVTAPISNPTDYFLTSTGATEWPKQTTPGVFVHAQMVDFLLRAAIDGKPVIQVWRNWQEAVWIGAWAIAGAILALSSRSKMRLFLGLLAGLIILYGACLGLLVQGAWVPLIPPALALVLSSVGVFWVNGGSLRKVWVFEKQSPFGKRDEP